jgi:predicted transcriptional regulator of viral defense system
MTRSKDELPAGRARLAAVISTAGDVVRIEDAVKALGLPRTQAAKLLSRWAAQGWLRHVGKGAYVPVQLDLLDAGTVVEDPWILVPALFAPAYIGGRTAAEHWDLTEQIFRDIVVFTARPVRVKTVERQSAVFTLKHIREDRIFGIKPVWRRQSKIAVSDIHRTIVDMLDDPAVGGGIQHAADCFDRYLQRQDCDPEKLIAYAERLGNGAIFKRLGFLAERHPLGETLAQAAKHRLTKGHTKLDPALECPRLITRWRLRVPRTWVREPARD